MSKNMLFIIDMQNDFVEKDGSLYVDGAVEDVKNVCDFITKYGDKLTHIVTSQDIHSEYHICHPKFWLDENGNHPLPFTEVTEKDILQHRYRPYDENVYSYLVEYFKILSSKNRTHMIWS